MADRYWVGGAGTWNGTSTTNWSTTSGGAAGASAPTSADDVFFDANSATSGLNYTVNSDPGAVCKSLNLAGTAERTLYMNVALDVYGNITWGSNVIVRTFMITMKNAAPATITTNGVNPFLTPYIQSFMLQGAGLVTILGTFGSSARGASISISGAGGIASSNNTIYSGSSFSTTNTSVPVQLPGCTVYAEQWSLYAANTMSAADAPASIFAGTVFIGGGKTYNNLEFVNSTNNDLLIRDANTFTGSLTIPATTTAGVRAVVLEANQVISGTLSVTPFGFANSRCMLRSNVIGTPRTLTCGAVGSLVDVDFRDIEIAGGAVSGGSVTGTRLGDCGGNSGIAFPVAKTVYYFGTSAGTNDFSVRTNWSLAIGGPSGTDEGSAFPLAQDTAVIPANYPPSGASLRIANNFNIGTLDMSARTTGQTLTLQYQAAAPFHGGLKFPSGTNAVSITTTGSTMLFYGRGAMEISGTTSFAGNFPCSILMEAPGGTLALSGTSNFNMGSQTFSLIRGTLNLNNKPLLCYAFNSSGAVVGDSGITFGTDAATCYIQVTQFNATANAPSVTGVAALRATGAATCSVGSRSRANAFQVRVVSGATSFSPGSFDCYDSITFDNVAASFAMSGKTITLYRNLTLSTGMSMSGTGTYKFDPGAGVTSLLTSGGKIHNNIDVLSGTLAPVDSLTCVGAINTYAGASYNGNGTTTSADQLAGQGSFNFSFSSITVTGVTPLALSGAGSIGGMTTINFSASNVNLNVPTAQDLGNVTFTSTSALGHSIATTGVAPNIANLTIANRSAAGCMTVSIGADLTLTGTLRFSTGGGQNCRMLVTSNTPGVQRVITAAAWFASSGDTDFRNIAIAGAAISGGPVTGTRLGNAGGNSGISFAAAKTSYWRSGASANWSSSSSWSATSGGTATVTAFPLPQDTVIFTPIYPLSGNTVTVDFDYAIGNVDLSQRTTNTMAFSFTLGGLAGSLTLGSGVTGGIVMAPANGVTSTITGSAACTISMQAQGGTVSLPVGGIALNGFTLTRGTLDLNGQVLTSGVFTLGSTTDARSIISGTGGRIDVSGTSGTVLTFGSASAVLPTAPLFRLTGNSTAGQTRTVTTPTSGTNTYSLEVAAGAGTVSINNASPRFIDLDLTGFSGTINPSAAAQVVIYGGKLTLEPAATLGANVTNFSFANQAASAVTIVTSAGKTLPGATTFSPVGTVRLADALTAGLSVGVTSGTLDLNGYTLTAPLFNATGTQTIAFGETGAIAITSTAASTVFGGTGATTYTGSRNVRLVGNTASGTAQTVSGPTTTITTAAPNLFVTNGAGTLSTTGGWLDVDFAGFVGTWTTGSATIHGDLTLSSGMTVGASASTLTIGGRAVLGASWLPQNAAINTAGKTLDFPMVIDRGQGSTLTLGAAVTLAAARTCTLTSGILDAAGFTLTTGLFNSSSATYEREIRNPGQITLTGTGSVWNVAAGLLELASPPNITLTDASATARTFGGGGMSYGTLSIGGSAGTSTLTITGNNRFASLESSKTVAHTVVFPNSAVTVVDDLALQGTAGNLVTLSRTGASGTFKLALPSRLTRNYLSISNCYCVRAPLFVQTGGSGSGNTGVVFGSAATASRGALYWVGGTASWTAAGTTWALTSGGTTGQAAPYGDENAVFDGAGAVTALSEVICASLNLGGSTILAGTAQINVNGDLNVTTSGTPTYTGTLNFTGSGTLTTNRALSFPIAVDSQGGTVTLAQDTTTGSTRTFTLNAGTLNLNNFDLITGLFATGANAPTVAFGTDGVVLLTGTGTAFSGNAALRATGSKNIIVGAGGSIAITLTPGAVRERDALNFSVSGGSYALTTTAGNSFGDLVFPPSFTGSWTASSVSFFGNLVIGANMSLPTGSGTPTFAATGAIRFLITNGKTLEWNILVDNATRSVAGGLRLIDALTMGATRTLTLTSGKFDSAGYAVTGLSAFLSNNSNPRSLAIGASNWTVVGTSPWTMGTGLNASVSGSGVISLTSASPKTFAGGSLDYGQIALNQGGAGTLTISGNNTLGDLRDSSTGGVTLTAGTTTRLHKFSLVGASGSLLAFAGGTGGATVVKPTAWDIGTGSTIATNAIGFSAASNSESVDFLSVSALTALIDETLALATSQLFYGSVNITSLLLGGTPVSAVYYGAIKVF